MGICQGTRYQLREPRTTTVTIDLEGADLGITKPGRRAYYNLKLEEPNIEYSLDDLDPPLLVEEREIICGMVVDHSYSCGPLRLALEQGTVADPCSPNPFKEIPPEAEYELIQQFQQIYFAAEDATPECPVCVLIEIIFEAEE